jgi:hypothetical protein
MTLTTTSFVRSISIVSVIALMVFVSGAALDASAATQYVYINADGIAVVVTANTSAEAFSKAVDKSIHSGVMLIDSTSDAAVVGDEVRVIDTNGVNLGGATQYVYVNADGIAVTVTANTSAEAFSRTVNKSIHSGVMLIDSSSDAAVVGDEVRVIDNQ